MEKYIEHTLTAAGCRWPAVSGLCDSNKQVMTLLHVFKQLEHYVVLQSLQIDRKMTIEPFKYAF